jgi:hypothetical protein
MKKTKAEKILYFYKITLYFLLFYPLTSGAQQPQSLQWLLYWLNSRIWDGWIVFASVLAGFLAFLGIVPVMKDMGNEEVRERFKKILPWAILTFFIMFSFWGIIKILQYTFFGSVFPTSIPQ